MFSFPVIFCCVLLGVAAKCPDNTEVYTGLSTVSWEAKLDGVKNKDILFPSNVPIFLAEEEVEITVRLKLTPPDLKLQEVSIETKNVIKVSVEGFPEKDQDLVPAVTKFTLTTFKFNKEVVNQIKLTVVSQGGEMVIKNVFVKGCVPVEWCPWSRWSKCSVTCGKGERVRSRVCKCPNPDPKLFTCEGPSKGSIKCKGPCCEETIDYNNNRGDIRIYVDGPSGDDINGEHLLRGYSNKLITLVSNKDGTDKIVVEFVGNRRDRRRDIIAVGLKTRLESTITMTTAPGGVVLQNEVDPEQGIQKTLFKVAKPIKNQESITLTFSYPKGEIAVGGIYLIVCQ